jgi:quercetin dioxygenase-like cupin family protein
MYRAISFAALAAAVTATGAANFGAAQTMHTVVTAGSIEWGPAPPGMPKGLQQVVLAGDPRQAGPFIVRAKMPDGYTIAPHWHSQAEHLTVLSGRLHVGMGDTLDRAKAQPLGTGDFIAMPAKMRHSVRAVGETVVQVVGTGPFDITYVDPKDDPRKADAQ